MTKHEYFLLKVAFIALFLGLVSSQTCPSPCASCSGSICLTCNPGFYLYTPLNSCLSCLSNCQICTTNRSSCDSCSPGYYSSSSATCSSCHSSCPTCISRYNCTSCVAGLTLRSGWCFTCSVTNCMVCSGSQCSECENGYGLVNGACLAGEGSGSNQEDDKGWMKILMIVGIVVSAVIFIMLVVVCCIRRKMRNSEEEQKRKGEVAGSGVSLERLESGKQSLIWRPYPQGRAIKCQTCPICLAYKIDLLTSCRHHFHASCLALWNRSKKTCPQCRCQYDPTVRILCKGCWSMYREIPLREMGKGEAEVCEGCPGETLDRTSA